MKTRMTTILKAASARKLLKLLLIGAGLFSFSSAMAQPAARMGISPDRYQVSFDERGGETQSLVIQNLSDKPLHLSLSVSNWDLDESNQISVAPPTENSLDQWIVINPVKITVPPATPQTVRWAILPRLKPQPGEYRAIIFIEEDLPEQQAADGTEVRMKMRYGMPIYAQVGEAVESARLQQVTVASDGTSAALELLNDGNKHARLGGNYGIWPSSEFPGSDKALGMLRELSPEEAGSVDFMVGNLPGSVILPGDQRALPVTFAGLEEGEYTIQFNATFAQLEITNTIGFSRRDEDPATFRVATLDAEQRLVSGGE